MQSELLNFFLRTPYSIPHIIGIFLFTQALVFYEVSKRSKDKYSLMLSVGLLFLSIAWGTTDYQNTGLRYADWGWWWAQPFFAVGILFISVGVIRYLPLGAQYKRRLLIASVIFPVLYVCLGTVSLCLGLRIERAYIIWMQLPPFFAISYATLSAERGEPKKGHRLIGLLGLTVPILSIVFPALGVKTAVLRFWTAVPLLMLAAIILAASLLREREKIQETLDELKLADEQLQALNKSLESKVESRTAMLHEIIKDLESFNRSVSHDLRSPLGSISMTAHIAEKYLAMGQHEQVASELKSIKGQVDGLQGLVATMLNLASNLESPPRINAIAFREFISVRASRTVRGLTHSFPNLSSALIQVDDCGVIHTNDQLFGIVIDNLIDNAVKHNAGAPNLKIHIGVDPTPAEYIVFVRDNGVGIGEDSSGTGAELYLPFRRIDRSGGSGGYGLGLNIVKRAVRKLGGRVWFEPTQGGGVTFFFTLPVVSQAAQ